MLPQVTDSLPSGKSHLSQLTGLSLSIATRKKPAHVPTAKFVARPGFCQTGTELTVISNHYPLEIADSVVYHYDLDIEVTRGLTCPLVNDDNLWGRRGSGENGINVKKLRRMTYKTNRLVIQQMIDDHSMSPEQPFYGLIPVYDGLKNLYTAKPILEFERPKRVFTTIDDGTGPKVYAINIQYVGRIDLNDINLYYKKQLAFIPNECIQVLDIILRHGPNFCRIPVGKSLYVGSEASTRMPIGNGREVAFGYYQSVRGCMGGANLVVDRATTVFYAEGPLLSFVAQILAGNHMMPGGRLPDEERLLSVPQLRDYDRKKVEREVKNLQIEVHHLHYRRKYRISGLTYYPARDVTFRYLKNGEFQGMITIPDYFKREYGVELLYPNLPCVAVGNGNQKKFLPIEICHLVPNQVIQRKLAGEQLAKMVRTVASQQPAQRFGVIQDSIDSVVGDSLPFCNEFGVRIRNQPMMIEARVLDAPLLKYAGAEANSVQPQNGVWFMEKRQNLFKSATDLHDNWVLVNFAPYCTDEDAELFVDGLVSKAMEMGLQMSKPAKVARVYSYKPGMIEGIFQKAKSSASNLKLILFIVTGEESLYHEIKIVGDVQEGIPTQCVAEKNIRKLTPTFFSNLILKINTKLGGVNSVLSPEQPLPEILSASEGVMIIGADVTHPSADRSVISSVAALVGSYDSNCSQYYASVRVQAKDKQEVIKNMDDMAVELLQKYRDENHGKLPKHIVIYRDGVSEGQFSHVLRQELGFFHLACDKIKAGYSPMITLIIVQKRHHTRFLPAIEAQGVGRNRNIPPGTVVDKDCVDPTDFDFFLCSHFGVQGTSRPTHYYVLWDDNKFGADQLQKLTFHLCHMYAKCNRSISIPAPVQYAHLAAYRARIHIIGIYGSEFSGNSGSYDRNGRRFNRKEAEEAKLRMIQEYNETICVSEQVKRSMYFC